MLLLAMVSGSAVAEWVTEGENEEEVFFSAHDSIHSKDGMVKMLVLLDEKKAKKEPSTGKKYWSVLARNEFDCTEAKTRVIYAYYYSSRKGEGDIIFAVNEPSQWIQIVQNSRDESLWKVACGIE